MNSPVMSNVIAGLIVAGIVWYFGKRAASGVADAASEVIQSAQDFGATVGRQVTEGARVYSYGIFPTQAEMEAEARAQVAYWDFVKALSQAASSAETSTTQTTTGKTLQ